MKRNLRYTALLLFMLSTVYASAQSLRKLMEMPPRIIESKWEQTSDGGTELNYYNEDLCSYYLFPRKRPFVQFESRKEHGIQNRKRL